MALELPKLCAGLDVPQADAAVVATRRQLRAVWTEGHSKHATVVEEGAPFSRPVATSHSRTVRSSPARPRFRCSGLNTTVETLQLPSSSQP